MSVVPDPSPFDLPATSPERWPGGVEPAALCIHGLTGTPYEVRPIAEALSERGIRARGPVLPGHDSTPEELARLRGSDWLDAARAELEQLFDRHETVFLVGLSLGGVLSLSLASEDDRVSALAVVGVPLRLAGPIPWLVPFAKHVMPFLSKSQGSDIQDPEARERHPGYKRMPLHSVHQLVGLQNRLAGRLGRIRMPVLAAHGAKDRTASPADSKRILEEVSSTVREHLVLERSGHVAPVDYEGARLAEAVADFLARHATTRAGG